MKNSKKLLAAVAALVVALAVSVGSTFAWFTTNSKVQVSNIEANVTTGSSNLEVALVGVQGIKGLVGDFTYNLDLSKTIAEGGLQEVFAATKFDALTDNGELTGDTLATATWGGTTKKGLELRDKKGANATASSIKTVPAEGEGAPSYAGETGNYLKFTLRFRTTAGAKANSSGNIPLYLAPQSKVTSTPGANHSDLTAPEASGETYPLSGFGFSAGQKMGSNAKDAMRIAFHGATVKAPSPDTTSGNGVDEVVDSTGAKGKVWEPNATEGWGAEKWATAGKFSQKVEELIDNVPDLSKLYADPSYDATTDLGKANTDPTLGLELAEMVQEADGYYYANVTVIIWLEGTDADCLNSIFGDLVTITLNFQVEEVK